MSWSKVVWQASYVDADNFRSPYDLDLSPDLSPAVGSVTLYPVQRPILSGQQTFMPRPVVCTFDDEGFLCGPDGTRGVYVLPTPVVQTDPNVPINVFDAETFTVEWLWSCKPSVEGVKYVKPFSFVALENTVVDLSAWCYANSNTNIKLAPVSVDAFVLERVNATPTITGANVSAPGNRLSFIFSDGRVVDAGVLNVPTVGVASVGVPGVVSPGAGLAVSADGVLSVDGAVGPQGPPGQGIATATFDDTTAATVARPEATGLVYWFYTGTTAPPPRPTNAVNYDLVFTTTGG